MNEEKNTYFSLRTNVLHAKYLPEPNLCWFWDLESLKWDNKIKSNWKFYVDLTVLTFETFLKWFDRHQPIDDSFYVTWRGMTNAQINCFFGDVFVSHPCALQNIQHFSHVAIGQFDKRFFAIIGHFQAKTE